AVLGRRTRAVWSGRMSIRAPLRLHRGTKTISDPHVTGAARLRRACAMSIELPDVTQGAYTVIGPAEPIGEPHVTSRTWRRRVNAAAAGNPNMPLPAGRHAEVSLPQ